MPNGLELVNNAVNTLGNLNSLANVQSGLRTMSCLVTDSIQENVGLRGKDSGLRIEDSGLRIEEQGARENVWASFIHSKEKIEGRRTGHLEQNSTLQYNGTVVGADLWGGKHGFGGVALSYADGNVHSNQSSSVVKTAEDAGISWQTKTKIAGGNDAGSIQNAGSGVKVLAVSVPCRYLHSPVCVIRESDAEACEKLAYALIPAIQEMGATDDF